MGTEGLLVLSVFLLSLVICWMMCQKCPGDRGLFCAVSGDASGAPAGQELDNARGKRSAGESSGSCYAGRIQGNDSMSFLFSGAEQHSDL